MADPNYGGGYAQGTSSTMYSGTPSATGYGVSQGYQSTAAPGYQTATSSYQSAGYQVPGQAPAPTYAAPPAYQAPSQYSGYPADTSGSTVAGAVSAAYPTVNTSSYQGYGQPQTTSGYSSTSGGNYQQQGYQHGSSYQSSGHGGYGSQGGGYGGGGGYQGDRGRSSYGQQGASYGQGGGYGGGMQSGPRGGSRGGSRPGGYNSNVGYGDPSGGGSHQEGKRFKFSGKGVDVWALGITLYCFVFGKVPFDDTNRMERFEIIMAKRPPLNPQLEDLILRMLTKDANERITIPDIKILVKSMLKYHTFGSQTKLERMRSHSQPNIAQVAEDRRITKI